MQSSERQIFFSALDRTVIGAMHVDLFGESFLTDPECLSVFAQRISYPLLQRCSFHNKG